MELRRSKFDFDYVQLSALCSMQKVFNVDVNVRNQPLASAGIGTTLASEMMLRVA